MPVFAETMETVQRVWRNFMNPSLTRKVQVEFSVRWTLLFQMTLQGTFAHFKPEANSMAILELWRSISDFGVIFLDDKGSSETTSKAVKSGGGTMIGVERLRLL